MPLAKPANGISVAAGSSIQQMSLEATQNLSREFKSE
jgi:hypothetical protein